MSPTDCYENWFSRSETIVFAYIGMALFSFEHIFQASFCFGTIFLTLLGRAANIYPLAYIVNKFRAVKINKRMQFVMWFSGLRGAIAYVLSLHLEMDSLEKRKIIITGTLTEVLFTIIVLGGSTYPLIKFLKITGKTPRRAAMSTKKGSPTQGESVVTLIKTVHASAAIESEFSSFYDTETMSSESTSGTEHSSFLKPADGAELVKKIPKKRKRRRKKEAGSSDSQTVTSAFTRLDATFLVPFLCRRVTRDELISNRTQMRQFASKWYDEVRFNKPMQLVRNKVFLDRL